MEIHKPTLPVHRRQNTVCVVCAGEIGEAKPGCLHEMSPAFLSGDQARCRVANLLDSLNSDQEEEEENNMSVRVGEVFSWVKLVWVDDDTFAIIGMFELAHWFTTGLFSIVRKLKVWEDQPKNVVDF